MLSGLEFVSVVDLDSMLNWLDIVLACLRDSIRIVFRLNLVRDIYSLIQFEHAL